MVSCSKAELNIFIGALGIFAVGTKAYNIVYESSQIFIKYSSVCFREKTQSVLSYKQTFCVRLFEGNCSLVCSTFENADSLFVYIFICVLESYNI